MGEQPANQPSMGMTIARNTLVVTLGTVALKAVNFLFNVYVIRQLGDDRFGQYSVVLAFAGIYQIFAELGISVYAMRETARDHSRASELFWNLAAVRVILALIAMVLMPLIAVWMGYSQQLVLGIFLFACTFLLSAFIGPIQGLLTAFERFDAVTWQQIIGQIVFVIFGAIFLFSGLSYIWLIIAGLISLIPQIVMGMLLIRRKRMLTGKVAINPASWLPLVRAGLPFALTTLALSVIIRIDTLVLKAYTTDSVVGWYNSAYNLVIALMFLIYGFKEAIVPSLTRTYVDNPAEIDLWFHRAVKFILVISLPIAVGGMLVSTDLMQLLYGEEFIPAGVALAILIWDVPLYMYNSFCGNITIIISAERMAARLNSVQAVVKVTLMFLSVPVYGLIGAAVSAVITDLVGAVLFYLILRRRLHFSSLTAEWVKVSLASVLMGLMIYFLPNLHVIARIGIGFSVYLVLVFVFRMLDDNEMALINRLLHLRKKTAS